MEDKKNTSSDHTRLRSLFLCIGLCISLLIIFLAFETKAAYANRDFYCDFAPFPEWTPIIPRTTFPEKRIPEPIKPLAKPKSIVISTEPLEETVKEVVKAILKEPIMDEPVFADWKDDTETYEGPIDDFRIIEEPATFPGGANAWVKFLKKNIKYPKLAKRSGIEGKVFLSFQIDPEGNLSDIKVVKGIGGGCDEEAIRVLKQSPQWNPGKQRGHPVKSQMSLFIKFILK
ncbi:energy transducer TonB [Roseivirga misakiensis]|uniref:TonB C-terminal domain-containing protein n=1 Tax=Roseivirga misakiensis TaxID=1563681 RepID=A0A1E5T288_9BACT|nr:energy transducer TonB [Roseivirga misakiensis]OEK05480.1 hypothetical protein BFP71_19045 [Roseivirga misakiensis]